MFIKLYGRIHIWVNGCSARRNMATLTICMPPVSVIRDDVIVGHLPRNISTPCHMFLRFGGTIESVVNGARRYSSSRNA